MATEKLPAHLFSTYQQYKQDTQMIAGWLLENSSQASLSMLNDKDTNAQQAKQPRLKGKARKIAREATASRKYTTHDAEPKRKVNTSELVPMACSIVSAVPKVKLSQAMQGVFRRAIEARRSCGDWFMANSRGSSMENKKHSYFADLLEKILRTLRPCWEAESTRVDPSKPSQPAHADMKAFTNIFEHLELQDPPDISEAVPEAETAESQQPTEYLATIIFDETEIEAEFVFAVWSYLFELAKVRLYVQDMWNIYKNGHVDLATVAIVTNTAIDLVRHAEPEFERSLTWPSKYSTYTTGTLPLIVFYDHLDVTNVGAMDFDPRIPGGVVICGCVVCSLCLYIPGVTSRQYIDLVADEKKQQEVTPQNPQVALPQFSQRRNMEDMIHGERYNARNPSQKAYDRLTRFLPDLVAMALLHKGHFIEDEAKHAARHLYQKKEAPLWVCFALQVSLIIDDVMASQVSTAFQDLKEEVIRTKSRYEDHRNFNKATRSHTSRVDSHLETLVSEFGDWVLTNKYGKMMPGSHDREQLLLQHPLTCGTMKMELAIEWHVLGLRLVNQNTCIAAMAHLYNVAQLADPGLVRWPDMELVIFAQDPEKIFIGGRPRNYLEAERKIMLFCGVSMAQFAKNRRSNAKLSHSRPRTLSHAPIANLLFDRFLSQEETRKVDESASKLQQTVLRPERCQRILQQLWLPIFMQGALLADWQRDRTQSGDIIVTLDALTRSLMSEWNEFHFDYFSMHRACHGLLVAINKGMVEEEFDDLANASANMIGYGPLMFAGLLLKSTTGHEQMTEVLRSTPKSSSETDLGIAKILEAQIKALDVEADEKTDMLGLIKNVRRDGALKVMQTLCTPGEENSAASQLFRPVTQAIRDLVGKGDGDKRIKDLKSLLPRNKKDSEAVFRCEVLRNFYGPDQEEEYGKLFQKSVAARCFKKESQGLPEDMMMTMVCATKTDPRTIIY